MKTIVTAIFVLAIIAMYGCNKEPLEINIPFPEEAVQYFYFKTGSYWIYQNSKSSEIDSIWVTESIRIPDNSYSYDKTKYYKKEFIRMYSLTSLYPNKGNWDFYFKPFGSSFVLYGGRNTYMQPSGNCTLWKYPFDGGLNQVSDIKGNDTSMFRVLGTHYTVTIGNKTYSSVLKVNITNCIFMDKHDINMYWAPNYGIIKIEDLDDSSNWELIRHHLIQ